MSINFTSEVKDINPYEPTINPNSKKRMSRKKKKEWKENREIEKEMENVKAEKTKQQIQMFQTNILKSMFLTYFRILKYTNNNKLYPPVLEGLAKYAHLINVDFMDDLLKTLRDILIEHKLNLESSLNAVLAAFGLQESNQFFFF
jgi:nucleolar complex protein 3